MRDLLVATITLLIVAITILYTFTFLLDGACQKITDHQWEMSRAARGIDE